MDDEAKYKKVADEAERLIAELSRMYGQSAVPVVLSAAVVFAVKWGDVDAVKRILTELVEMVDDVVAEHEKSRH